MDPIICCLAAIGLHIGSAHLVVHPGVDLSNANYGIYAEFKGGAVVGALRNSLGRQSAYAAYNYRFAPVAGITPSIIVGGITGYPGVKVAPMLMPSIYMPVSEQGGIRLSYILKTRQTLAHVLHLSVEYRF